MSYKNAENILPRELLEKVQQYANGECLYIPRKEDTKLNWGTLTATKRILEERNQAIFQDYQNGLTTSQLAGKYHLSVKSIQRIVRKSKIQV